MEKSRLPPGIPKEGFIKLTRPEPPNLDPAQRAALIRQGNVLLNQGDLLQAKRIFFTVDYRDGMTRVGQELVKRGDFLEALRMFYLAKDRRHWEPLVKRMAAVVSRWLRSEG